MLFIVYLKQEDNINPIVCEDIVMHPTLKGFILLVRIKYADSRIAPSFKIEEMAVREKDLSHYVRGTPIKKEGT